jgi:hypothetical protein
MLSTNLSQEEGNVPNIYLILPTNVIKTGINLFGMDQLYNTLLNYIYYN